MSKFEFSEMQINAIRHDKGPALVIAGPGSGKTTVIISRLLRLASEYTDSKFLSLTFSSAAAKEMASRFSTAVADSSMSPYEKASALERTDFSTVHALAYSVMLDSAAFHGRKVIESDEKISCIKSLSKEINSEELPLSDCDTLVSFIGRIRSNPAQKEKLMKNIQVRNFEKIYNGYAEYKKQNGLIDFEDMVSEAVVLLQSDKYIRKKFCQKYAFVQADEAQDLTSEQFCFIRLLSPEQNIFVVGDDDQSIYGFRGASPECMKEFAETSGCRFYALSENHRCCSKVVSLSSRIICQNSGRFSKNLISVTATEGKVNLLHVKDSCCLGRFIVSDLSSGSAGILYRNNRSAFSVMTALINAKIPFSVNGSVFCEIDRYFNLFYLECIKENITPRRFIRKKGAEEIRNMFLKSNSLYRKDRENVDLALDLVLLLAKLYKSTVDFQAAAAKLFTVAEEGVFLPAEKPHVFLSTIHSSKGLEYDNVYIIDVNKNEFPGKSSAEGKLLCEERRLFYVGITRAKSRLNIIYSENRSGTKSEESILFREALKAGTGIPGSPHKE